MYNKRYCISKFEIEGKSVLLVSFHGTHIRLSNRLKKIKLSQFLQKFCQYKKDLQCDHLIIGGDFNLDLDEFNNENLLFMQSLKLKIVPYKNQRCFIPDPRKNHIHSKYDLKKIDGLICDLDTEVESVVVFTDKNQKDESDPQTLVVKSNLPRHLLDHHPTLFKLRLPSKKNGQVQRYGYEERGNPCVSFTNILQ